MRPIAASRLNRWIVHADRLVEEGRQDAAERLLRRAVERASGDPRAPLRLYRLTIPPEPGAAVARPSPELRSAAVEVRRMLEGVAASPGSPQGGSAPRVDLMVSWTIAVAGDHRAAIEAVQSGVEHLDGAAADCLRRLAALAVMRHDLAAADGALSAARRADAAGIELVTDQATVALARGLSTRAVTLFREALGRSPESRPIQRDLAGALLAAGHADEALSLLSLVAESCEGVERARCQLDVARAALEAGRHARAVAAAGRSLARSEAHDPQPALVLAAALRASGRGADAAEAYREALRRDPDNRRAREGLRSLMGAAPPGGP